MPPSKVPEWQTNEKTKAYWKPIADSIRTRDWSDGSELPKEGDTTVKNRCPVCGNAGFVLHIYRRPKLVRNKAGEVVETAWEEVSREYGACPEKDCPGRAKHLQRVRSDILSASEIPSEYVKMYFANWEKLKAKKAKADGTHPLNGKKDALGAAQLFYERRNAGYLFTLTEAAERQGLPAPTDDKGEPLDKGAKLNSVVFAGPNGTGKTSLSCAIANALLADGVTVVYVRMSRFFLALRERMNNGKATFVTAGSAADEAEVMALYANADILFIDEFPLEATQWQKERGGELINERYSNGKPTIITTNARSVDDLVPAWDHLVADRIAHMAHWFVLGGVQLRTTRKGIVSR